jgi:predicted 3-demethylubiquinone-9 3-methyltransferase (glyoxalase superfamily)
MQKITPFLWFNDQAEEAAKFYTSIFKNSKIQTITHYGEEVAKASGKPNGSVMTAAFQLDGQNFIALNGGPQFKFNESVSFVVNCETQDEIDQYWEKLSEGGEKGRCGWLKDKYGLSWQVVPSNLNQLLQGSDAAQTQRVMHAIMQMDKLDIAKLKQAYGQQPIAG